MRGLAYYWMSVFWALENEVNKMPLLLWTRCVTWCLWAELKGDPDGNRAGYQLGSLLPCTLANAAGSSGRDFLSQGECLHLKTGTWDKTFQYCLYCEIVKQPLTYLLHVLFSLLVCNTSSLSNFFYLESKNWMFEIVLLSIRCIRASSSAVC